MGNSTKKYKTSKLLHVTRYWTPGTGLEEITNIARKEIDELTKKYIGCIFKVSHPRCVGEHNISKTAVEIVFNTTVLLELKYLTYYKVRHVKKS